MSNREAIEYFYTQMEHGNIQSDAMQMAYECAIEALEALERGTTHEDSGGKS